MLQAHLEGLMQVVVDLVERYRAAGVLLLLAPHARLIWLRAGRSTGLKKKRGGGINFLFTGNSRSSNLALVQIVWTAVLPETTRAMPGEGWLQQPPTIWLLNVLLELRWKSSTSEVIRGSPRFD